MVNPHLMGVAGNAKSTYQAYNAVFLRPATFQSVMEHEKSRLDGTLSALSAHYFAQEFTPRQLCVNLLHTVSVIKTRQENVNQCPWVDHWTPPSSSLPVSPRQLAARRKTG
jgi:hypothetical protein